MRYGYFDDERREYVITRPDTPLPWINYLGNQDYFGLISNTAGGYSFYRDARLRRLTRYRYNNVPTDTGGRYLYLRDDETGLFWSPTWQPTRQSLDEYECRHGIGYTNIHSSYAGIRAAITYFVPLDETLEIWRLSLTNLSSRPRTLSLFSALEFALWDAWDDATNYQRNFNIGEVEVDVTSRRLVAPISGGATTLMSVLRQLGDCSVGVSDVGLRRPTLDDVFLSLTGHLAESTDGDGDGDGDDRDAGERVGAGLPVGGTAPHNGSTPGSNTDAEGVLS